MHLMTKQGHNIIKIISAPCGLITFMSKAYGGRITDSQIVFDTGMMEKLESEDSVMCDKGFPEVRYFKA